ncbi:MAG: pyruvate dehydrogenase complex dihydrolipoamide acetyltransferase [Hyphomicrobiaceae bacterium]|nr:pyruvate dehydrogenase complex dihydrolipoamide acetyltransferase [Hyphomicrobiaceae bacterium]
MSIPILMPALSPTMETGKLAKWHVKEGDEIAPGDVIAEIETDKAVMEVEAIEEGRIGKLYIAEGEADVPVNTMIAMVLTDDDEGDDDKEAETPASSAPTSPLIETTQSQAAPVALVATPVVKEAGDRLFASPLARRIAKENKLSLAGISGSGPRGRIVKKDVELALANGSAASPDGVKAVATAPVVGAGLAAANTAVSAPKTPAGLDDKEIFSLYEEGSYEVVPHDNMRRIIADRLTLAKSTIPHFYLSIDCELDELLQARKRMNEAVAADGVRLSVNDFIIKALALAMQKVPDANATWGGQGVLKHKRSDVAVAVAVEGGLFPPVIRHADLKTLSEISNEMKDLAHRARSKKLAPHEYQGGTTSISNLGMFDIKQFDAVINPPHASILAVGRGQQRPVVKEGELAVANVMSCTLSCDHRVIDGALGAQLLKAFKTYIEEPVTMLV